MAGRNRSSGNQGNRVGCLFILFAFCVGILVFLLNMGKIKETLERTNFKEIMKTQSSSDTRKSSPVSPAAQVQDDPPASLKTVEPKPSAALSPEAGKTVPADGGPASSSTPSSVSPSSKPGATDPAKSAGSSPKKATSAAQGGQSPAAPAQKTRSALLYFVRIDDDGVIVRQEVSRQISASDQPLTDALSALLSGPSEAELRRQLLSLIPQGTKLLTVQVRGSTAFLNFNEAFMYNHYGIEGYAGQLKQIVYTATAFSSVLDVQILIEGERHDYLGGEGVYIGRPLSRSSF